LLSHVTTPAPPNCAKTAASSTVDGVLPAPPLPFTIEIVRGPGQCWLTARSSVRSARSAWLGPTRMPIRVSIPRNPRVAGSSSCWWVRNDSRTSRRERGASPSVTGIGSDGGADSPPPVLLAPGTAWTGPDGGLAGRPGMLPGIMAGMLPWRVLGGLDAMPLLASSVASSRVHSATGSSLPASGFAPLGA
jgi:hypothetical protein